MPISAKFQADFSSFQDAVQKAEVKLKDLTSGADKVIPSLTRIGNSLNGTKLIQDATLMAQAVDKVGGVSTLTEKELQRLGAQAQEAAAKMKALGLGVPENLQKIAEAAKPVDAAMGKLVDTGKQLAAAVGIGFSIGAVVEFGKALLADADELVKLSDKTGVSLQGLQKFQIAGDEAGNSIDDLTGAITKMEDKLVGGDAKALQALKDLKIPFEDIKNLNPENQFIAISDALRQVQDPAKQVAIAIDLFGKQGAAVLPTLKRGFDDLKGATVGMSDETVRAMDKAGDEIGKWWRLTKGYTAEATVAFAHYVTDGITPAQQATSQLRREMEDLNTQLKQMTAGVKSPLTLPQQLKVPTSTGSADEIATENERINKVLAKQDEARKKATTDLAEFQQRVNEDTATRQTKIYESIQKSFDDMMKDQMEMLKRTNQNTIDLVASFTHLRDVQHEAFGPSEAFTEGLDKLGTKVLPITNDELKNFEDRIKFVGPTLDQARAGLQTFGDFLKNDLGQVIVGAFQGGGNILQSAGSAIGGFLSGAGSTVGRALSTGVSKVFGSTIGSAIGSVIPGLGTALGGLVGGLFGKLFNDPEKQVNPIRQAFVDAAGGLAALNQRAHEAGVTLDHLLDAKTPEAYKAAIDELNVSLQFQDQAMKTLDDTVKKYGFTIEELGPALQRQNLDKQAQDLYQDFKVLTGAGIATDTVLGRMGDSINTFVHDALRTGTEIPAAMAPMLQRMVEMGTLTDENGNSITDLSAAGVTFSETMTQGFQKIVDAVQKLTDAITRGLGTAIDNIPDPHVTGTVDWQVNAPPGFDPNDSRYRDFPNTGDMEVVPMAGGGSGRVTSPTLFFSRGNEDFAFSGEGQSFSGGSSSSGDIAALSAAIARLPRTISRSIRDALVGMNG